MDIDKISQLIKDMDGSKTPVAFITTTRLLELIKASVAPACRYKPIGAPDSFGGIPIEAYATYAECVKKAIEYKRDGKYIVLFEDNACITFDDATMHIRYHNDEYLQELMKPREFKIEKKFFENTRLSKPYREPLPKPPRKL